MCVRAVIYLALFFIGMGCVARANLLFGDMVRSVNRLLPEAQAIKPWGFNRHRLFEILAEYRRLYPDGKLAVKAYVWTAIGFVSFFGVAVYWFFFSLGSAGTGR